MKKIFPLLVLFLWFLSIGISSYSQGLPPGWDFGATPSTHIISIPLSSDPNINAFPLLPGDYIGVFYLNSQGELACGGASEWLGNQNTGIIAFGDDSFTTIKDGFSYNEPITYKFYSWSVHKEYDCEVICNPNMLTTCDVFISGGLSGIDSIWANGFFIVASATPDLVCAGSPSQLQVIPSGGTGNYIYQWTSVPSGFTSTIANPVVFPAQNTLYNISVTNIAEVLQLSVNVATAPPPQSIAGNNATICENTILQLNGQQMNGSSFHWSTDGDGSFSSTTILNPLYTPGSDDISSGNAQLTLTVNGVGPCITPASSSVLVTIISLPEVFAGEDQLVCENNSVMASATVLNGLQLQWTTTGDGTFSTPNQLETLYFPGNNDLLSGNVELVISVNAISPCTGTSSDSFVVGFTNLPEVNAGNNQLICEDVNVLLNGISSDFSSSMWATNGDGTFENTSNLSTVYFPGSNDIISGDVELQLTVSAISPCTGQYQDNLTVIIIQFPLVNAGDDITICETGNLQLNGSCENFDEILWSSDGDGTFSDLTSLNTLYFPGANDVLLGQVQISLEAQPQFPCSVAAQDALSLSIQSLPFVNAGEDALLCENDNFLLSGEGENYSDILWLTNGDGSFEDANSLTTFYYPGTIDILSGSVDISLIAEPLAPCLLSSNDNLHLSIQVIPIADAGGDVTIQLPEILQLNGSAEDYSLLIWSTEGDGTFSNFAILDPIYSPGEEDINTAGTTLMLTAFPYSPCVVSDADELILTIDTLVGIQRRISSIGPEVYPNPSKGNVFVRLPDNLGGNLSLQIFNEKGEIVVDEFIDLMVPAFKSNLQFNLSGEKSGLYFLSITGENIKSLSKFLIIRD